MEVSKMSKQEAEAEIMRINSVLERCEELNLPESQQDELASYRNDLRAHVQYLNQLGLEEKPA